MSASLHYLDANVFLYAISPDPATKQAMAAKAILKLAADKKIYAVTSLLTWDEVTWVSRKLFGHSAAQAAGKNFLKLQGITFFPVTLQITELAQELLSEGLKPRDAIHVATAFASGCRVLVSEDADLDYPRKKLPRLGFEHVLKGR